MRAGLARIAALTLFAGPAAAQMSPPVPPANPPTNCTAPEYRQFDFWVGEWRVFRADRPDEMVGTSLIESVYNGCGIRENWQPFSMMTGGSLNIYSRTDRRWYQTWIDSGGSRVEFAGGLVGGNMVLTGLWRGFGGQGKDALTRMSYSPLPNGAVRQLIEASSDRGKSWKPSVDFIYKPRTSVEK